jgi:hypothetical protein
MRTAALLLALLVAVPLFPMAPAAGPGPAAVEVPFSVSGCAYVEFHFSAPPQRLAPLVPPQFRLRLTNGLALVLLGAAQCVQASFSGATGPAAFFWDDLAVDPVAPEVQQAGVGVYLWRIENAVLDDPYGAAMAAVGAQQGGATSIATTLAPMPGYDVAGGDFEHHGRGVGTGQHAGAPVRFREYGFSTDLHLVYVDATLTPPAVVQDGDGAVVVHPLSPAVRGLVPTAGPLSWADGYSFGPNPVMGRL